MTLYRQINDAIFADSMIDWIDSIVEWLLKIEIQKKNADLTGKKIESKTKTRQRVIQT